MNPLTNVKNITKLNEVELSRGLTNKSWHNIYKESAWIFIGGLAYGITEGDVIVVFSQFGEIVNINMVRDKKTGKTKGFCFLCYANQKSTVLAVDNLNGIKLCQRTIRVDHVANYKPPKEHENDDEVTKMLQTEGCAPKPLKASSSEDEVQILPTKPKKLKKEKKKKKHKRRHRSDSSPDSDEAQRHTNKHPKVSDSSRVEHYQNEPDRMQSTAHSQNGLKRPTNHTQNEPDRMQPTSHSRNRSERARPTSHSKNEPDRVQSTSQSRNRPEMAHPTRHSQNEPDRMQPAGHSRNELERVRPTNNFQNELERTHSTSYSNFNPTQKTTKRYDASKQSDEDSSSHKYHSKHKSMKKRHYSDSDSDRSSTPVDLHRKRERQTGHHLERTDKHQHSRSYRPQTNRRTSEKEHRH